MDVWPVIKMLGIGLGVVYIFAILLYVIYRIICNLEQ